MTFPCEVDRICLSVPSELRVVDPAGEKSVRMETENLPDAVVWNPWIEKSKATGDLGDEDYKAFVCVEAAAGRDPGCGTPGRIVEVQANPLHGEERAAVMMMAKQVLRIVRSSSRGRWREWHEVLRFAWDHRD